MPKQPENQQHYIVCPTCRSARIFTSFLIEECDFGVAAATIILDDIENQLIHQVPSFVYNDILAKTAKRLRQSYITDSMVRASSGACFKVPKDFDAWVKAKSK